MSSLFGAEERIPTRFLADPTAAITLLRQEWETYQHTGQIGGAIRPVIATSWTRSREQHVSPERRAADVDRASLRGFESRDIARGLYLQSTRPIVDQLAAELSGSESAVVVCDEVGKMLLRAGDSAILRQTEEQNFVPDAVWNEECAGTNGIGLALSLGRPAQVFAGEHFCVGFQSYACTAAPIRHPVTREVLGVLDVTTDVGGANFHTYAMVVHAARDVELQMEEHVFGRERELLERYLRGRVGLQTPFLTVDRSGRTIIQNAPAAQILTTEDLPVILRIVQEALRRGKDITHAAEVSSRRSQVTVHVVRSDDEVIGALVTVEPLSRTRRPSGTPAGERWSSIVGRSPVLTELLRKAGKVAEKCMPCVIEGQPGSGKLVLARAMHRRSERAEAPLMIVSCAVRGWRRDWEKALQTREGTIVLRRPGTLSDAHQLELAVEIEELQLYEASPWVIGIVATDDPPLRLELLHRLGRVRLGVPPLRERGKDSRLIALDWCRQVDRDDPPGPTLTPAALDLLDAYDWPGNVRELLSTLESARLSQRGTQITPYDLGLPTSVLRRGVPGNGLRDVEREAIERALAQTDGNVSRAAELLGTSRSTLHRRLRTYRVVG